MKDIISDWVDRRLRFLLLIPAFVILLGLTAFPTIYLFSVALQGYDPADPTASEWNNFANFARMFGDGQLWNALKNTAIFTFSAVGLEFVIGLSFAMLVDKYLKRLTFLKTVILIPMMLPTVAVAIVWKILYQPQFGLLNEILYTFGLEPIQWASGYGTAMMSVIIVDVWEWTPFVFLMCLAGLSSLPREPYEAAEIDGASAWDKFKDLTIPFLKPVLVITLLLRMMDALRLFDQVYILTRGGPAGATETISYYIYKVALRFADVGYAAAISIGLLALTIVISTYFIKRMRLE